MAVTAILKKIAVKNYHYLTDNVHSEINQKYLIKTNR